MYRKLTKKHEHATLIKECHQWAEAMARERILVGCPMYVGLSYLRGKRLLSKSENEVIVNFAKEQDRKHFGRGTVLGFILPALNLNWHSPRDPISSQLVAMIGCKLAQMTRIESKVEQLHQRIKRMAQLVLRDTLTRLLAKFITPYVHNYRRHTREILTAMVQELFTRIGHRVKHYAPDVQIRIADREDARLYIFSVLPKVRYEGVTESLWFATKIRKTNTLADGLSLLSDKLGVNFDAHMDNTRVERKREAKLRNKKLNFHLHACIKVRDC